MKKFSVFIVTVLVAFALASCGHFHDAPTVSVWADGVWAIWWAIFVGGAAFIIAAYRSSKSGGKQQVDLQSRNAHTEYSKKNVPIYKLAFFWGGIFLWLVDIGIIIGVNGSK